MQTPSTLDARCPVGWSLFYRIGLAYQAGDRLKHDRATEAHRLHFETCEECRWRRRSFMMAMRECEPSMQDDPTQIDAVQVVQNA